MARIIMSHPYLYMESGCVIYEAGGLVMSHRIGGGARRLTPGVCQWQTLRGGEIGDDKCQAMQTSRYQPS